MQGLSRCCKGCSFCLQQNASNIFQWGWLEEMRLWFKSDFSNCSSLFKNTAVIFPSSLSSSKRKKNSVLSRKLPCQRHFSKAFWPSAGVCEWWQELQAATHPQQLVQPFFPVTWTQTMQKWILTVESIVFIAIKQLRSVQFQNLYLAVPANFLQLPCWVLLRWLPKSTWLSLKLFFILLLSRLFVPMSAVSHRIVLGNARHGGGQMVAGRVAGESEKRGEGRWGWRQGM